MAKDNDVAVEHDREIAAATAATPTPLEVELDSKKAIERLGAVAQVIEGCVKVSIQRTNHLDWRKMGKGYYLQATGAQKIRPVWGIYYRDRKVTKVVEEDGTYAFLVEGTVGSKVLDQLYGEVVVDIDGGRASNDPFFAKGSRKPDWLDVRKASLANWEARAVTAILGLKNVSADDLRKNGVNVDAIGETEYQSGAEGGGNTTVISEAQAKRLWAIARTSGVPDESIKELCRLQGFATTYKITRDKYEGIVNVIEAGPAAVAKKLTELVQAKPQAAQPRDAGDEG